MKLKSVSVERHRRFLIALIGTSALCAALPAFAQDAPAATAAQNDPQNAAISQAAPDRGRDGEDIVVTARRRSESLISVPVAVSALTAVAINRYSSTDLSRIADLVPSVQITPASSGSGATIAIRGIYSSATDPGLESSVSVSIDGVQLSRGYITQAAFFDMQQVEVLKGPQALFFGKNSPAGVISLKSQGPTESLEGYARAGYEFRAKERYVEGAVSGPLGETLGYRVAGRFSDMDGWLKNLAGPIANSIEPGLPLPGATNNKTTPAARSIVGRVTLEWKPTNDFTATGKAFYSDYRNNELSGLQQALRCGGRSGPTSLGRIDPYDDCKVDNKRSFGALNQAVMDVYPFAKGKYFSTNKSFLGSLTLNYDLGDINLNTITGYYDLKANGLGNYDGTAYVAFPGINGENSQVFTQEARMTSSFDSPVNFMLGAYYEHSKRESFTVGRGGFGAVPFDPNNNGASVLYYPDDFVRSNTYSAFGQMLWDITDNLQASGGVRYTKESKNATLENIYINPLVPVAVAAFLPVGTVLPGKLRDSNWSPEASLTWHPVQDQTLYVSYKTGYKSGGFSTTAVLLKPRNCPVGGLDTSCAGLQFESESAKGAEVGYKALLLDRRLTFTSAIYSYKFSNLQRSSLNIATTSFQVRNAAASRSKGVEAEVNFRVMDGLSLRGGANLNKAYYLSFPTAPCFNGQTVPQGCVAGSQDITGQTLALAPRFTGNTGFTFDTPLSNTIGLGVTGDVKYTSGYRTQDDNTPGAYQKGYAKVNASARVHGTDDAWELSLIGLNLFNKYAIITSSSKPGGASGDLYGIVERGREVRVQGTYRF